VSVLCVAAVVSTASSALAKGPESATVSGPGIERPIELMDTADSELVVRLMEATGLWYATGDLPLSLEEPPRELGPRYTLTWINSGPPGESVDERTIRQAIYVGVENGLLIHTPAQRGLRGWGPGVIGWFAAPSGLRDTLAKLGVPIASSPSLHETPLSGIALDTAPPQREPARAFRYLAVAGFALVVGLAGVLGARRILRWSPVRPAGRQGPI
jgi:hypothetical protein